MPFGLRIMDDEEALRDEIRKNPKSTRWVSNRGIVRKNQGSCKEKRETVDEDYVRVTLARERYEEEIDGREMHERDARVRETHAREMQSHEHESPDIGTENRHGFNRRRDEDHFRISEPARLSDSYKIRAKKKEEYGFDYQTRHDARSTRHSTHFDTDEEDTEAYSTRPRRSYPRIPSSNQYIDKRANSTGLEAPRKTAVPSGYHPEDLRRRTSPSRGHQIPHAHLHTRPEAPQPEQPPRRTQRAPPNVEDVADDDDPMLGARRRDWSPPAAKNSRASQTRKEPPPRREERVPPAAETHADTSRGVRRNRDEIPPWREERAPRGPEETATGIDPWTGDRNARDARNARRGRQSFAVLRAEIQRLDGD